MLGAREKINKFEYRVIIPTSKRPYEIIMFTTIWSYASNKNWIPSFKRTEFCIQDGQTPGRTISCD